MCGEGSAKEAERCCKLSWFVGSWNPVMPTSPVAETFASFCSRCLLCCQSDYWQQMTPFEALATHKEES